MMYLSVVGHLCEDIIIKVPEIPKKGSIKVLEENIFFGGCGGNIARIAAKLGVPTSLFTYVGKDFSKDYLNALKEDNINLDGVKIMEGKGPKCYLITDGNKQIAFLNQGPMDTPYDMEDVVGSWVHLGTGNPLSYPKIAELAKKSSVKISFDPSQEIHYRYDKRILSEILSLTDILFCNEIELEKILELLDENMDELRKIVQVIIKTNHSEGVDVYAQEDFHVDALKVENVVDSTGAGDAFRGGFYAGLYRKFSLKESIRIGVSTASFVIEKIGAQSNLPIWTEVLERANIEKGDKDGY